MPRPLKAQLPGFGVLVLISVGAAQACTLYDAQLLGQATATSESNSTGAQPGDPSPNGGGLGGGLTMMPPGPSTGGSSNSTGGASQSTGGSPDSTGGMGGSTGGPTPTFQGFDFKKDLQGFFISFESTTGGPNAASWDKGEGEPDAGSAFLEVNTAGPDESVFFTRAFAEPLDLSGTQLIAQVKLDSGLSGIPSCQGGAYVIAKSGEAFVFARGPWRNLMTADGWSTIAMDLDAPDWEEGGFDSSDIREIGVGVATGGEGCAAPDWRSAKVHLDSIEYR